MIYLSRLGAVCTAASIFGQAAGGLLGSINCRVPLYTSACLSGVALLLTIFCAKESNPKVIAKHRKGNAVDNIEQKQSPSTSTAITDIENKSIPMTEAKHAGPVFRVSILMVICFLHEFCMNFSTAGYASRFSIYISEKFNMTTFVLS